MSYISVHDLSKSFTVRKKREKGHLLREKTQIQALQNISFDIMLLTSFLCLLFFHVEHPSMPQF